MITGCIGDTGLIGAATVDYASADEVEVVV